MHWSSSLYSIFCMFNRLLSYLVVDCKRSNSRFSMGTYTTLSAGLKPRNLQSEDAEERTSSIFPKSKQHHTWYAKEAVKLLQTNTQAQQTKHKPLFPFLGVCHVPASCTVCPKEHPARLRVIVWQSRMASALEPNLWLRLGISPRCCATKTEDETCSKMLDIVKAIVTVDMEMPMLYRSSWRPITLHCWSNEANVATRMRRLPSRHIISARKRCIVNEVT